MVTQTHPRLTPALHAAFLAALPRILTHARVSFRHLRCPHRRDDAHAEVAALCWLWFLRLDARGKDPSRFVSALATFAARQVRCGRGLCGQEPARDALSPRAQRDRGFAVSALPGVSTAGGNALDEALHDNTKTPVPEQVAFRHDFPAWKNTRSGRDRDILDDLMAGKRTRDVAGRHGLSPARVSQLRREFMEDWRRFCGADA